MNSNLKLANLAPRASLPLDIGSIHSVEDLKAMFEPPRRRVGRTIPTAIAFPNTTAASETTRTKCSWLSQHGNDKPGKMVPEKVKLFEEGRFDSCLSYTKRGMSMDDLLFIGNSVPTRKKDLMESTKSSQSSAWSRPTNNAYKNDASRSYYSSNYTRSDSVASSSWEDDCEMNIEDLLPPPETFHRFTFGRHQKRASTGRILFEDDPSVWKLTDSFATQVISDCSSTASESQSISSREEDGPSHFCADSPDTKTATRRPPTSAHHRRRYSTGRIGHVHVSQENISSPKDFWQVYQEEEDDKDDNDAASHHDDDPTMLRTEYRRTVRFDHHVTVWTFAKGNKKQRRTRRRRRRKDFRFQKKGHEHFRHTYPPDMPLRQQTNHGGGLDSLSRHKPSVVLPQTDRHFSLENSFSDVVNMANDSSPPLIPKRRPSLTQTDICSMPVWEDDAQVPPSPVFVHPRRDSTSTWGSLSSFANHDNLDETDHGRTHHNDVEDNDLGHGSHSHKQLHHNDGTAIATPQEVVVTRSTARRSRRPRSCGVGGTSGASGSTPTTTSNSAAGGGTPDRRAKALQWFHRLGMPNREAMKRLVTQTAGMDITVADVDLLPWDDAKYRRTGWASLHTHTTTGGTGGAGYTYS